MERCLWAPEDSVRLTASEYFASWLPNDGICSRACWEHNRRRHQAILAKDAIDQGREKEKKNKSRDLDKTGYKTGRDQADSKRRVGTAHRRQQETSRGRGGKRRPICTTRCARDLHTLWKRVYRSRKEAATQKFNTNKVSRL